MITKKERIISLLILFLFLFGVIGSFPLNNVSATSVSYIEGFEGGIATTHLSYAQSNSGIIKTVTGSGSNYISTGSKHNGTYGMQISVSSYITSTFNLTLNSGHNGITTFQWYDISSGWGSQGTFRFWNSTTGHDIVVINIGYATTTFLNEVGSSITFGTGNYNLWKKYKMEIVNDTGTVNYYEDNVKTVGIARYPSRINSGEMIDRIQFTETYNGGAVNVDDFSFIVSSSYNVGSGGGGQTQEGCIDTTDFMQFQNGLDADQHTTHGIYHHSEIEFTSFYPVSFTPEVFELMVLFPSDLLTDYLLYINGIYLGNPICSYPYATMDIYSIYCLQWDISSITEFNNTVLDFELVSTDVDAYDVYWTLYTSYYQDPLSNPFDIIWLSGDLDGVTPDGVGSIMSNVEGACWRIFYSVWNPNPPPVPYENNINFILEQNGFKQDGKYNDSVYLYQLQTGTIEYSVDTIGLYSLNITFSDDPTNYERIPINSYHDYFGFYAGVEYQYGYYYVTLEYTDNQTEVLSSEFYLANLSEYPPYNPDFFVSVGTDPNPSNTNSQYDVIVYINNFTRYDYWYVCRFTDDTESKGFTYAIDTISISGVNSENISTYSVYTRDSGGYETWILFATNDNELYLPLFEHKHNIRSIFSEAYLETDLPSNSGYINTEFNIIYYHSYYLSRVAVKSDGSIIKDYTDANQRTSFHYSSSVTGYHTLTLELADGNDWIVLDTVRIKLTDNGNGGGGGGFNIIIPQPYTYFAGIFVIIMFTLSPLAIVGFISKSSGRDFNFSSIPQFLYMILAIIGFIVTILMGWFPVWTVIILFVLCALIILIMYLKGKGTTEG